MHSLHLMILLNPCQITLSFISDIRVTFLLKALLTYNHTNKFNRLVQQAEYSVKFIHHMTIKQSVCIEFVSEESLVLTGSTALYNPFFVLPNEVMHPD